MARITAFYRGADVVIINGSDSGSRGTIARLTESQRHAHVTIPDGAGGHRTVRVAVSSLIWDRLTAPPLARERKAQ